MAKSIVCYETFCVEDNEHNANIGNFIVLGILLVAALGLALYSSADVIGTELLNNPLFTVF
ncbi:MAG: hypothetical protein P4N41_11005 [Negativicutes bacterium]|nr:hypothetical protein [Negativicutes bacterium]